MSDTHETISAILAEMREFCSGWGEDVDVTVKVGLIYGWACRLKEAAERERNAHTNDIHDALYMATGIPGNVAAMRSALEQLRDWALLDINENVPHMEEVNFRNFLHGSVKISNAALAAPARNCDRFQNWEDAASAWDEYSDAQYAARRKPIPVIPWLFAPVEGGQP